MEFTLAGMYPKGVEAVNNKLLTLPLVSIRLNTLLHYFI